MKSLVIKTILIISAVTLTSALAWSQGTVSSKKCDGYDPDRICDERDKNLAGATKPPGVTQGDSPECKYSDKRCFKNHTQVRMNESTAAKPSTGQSEEKTPTKGDR